jgi:hypothetical protein
LMRYLKRDSRDLGGLPIGMAYVPWQQWRAIYDDARALTRGTIFSELDLPFLGKGGVNPCAVKRY